MIVISHSICSYLLAMNIKTRFAHPRNVRVYFNISKSNYKANKKASIDFIPKLLNARQIDQANITRYTKRDDCAEAIILAFYAAKNYAAFEKVEDIRVVRSASRSSNTGKSSSISRSKQTGTKSKKRKKKRQRQPNSVVSGKKKKEIKLRRNSSSSSRSSNKKRKL